MDNYPPLHVRFDHIDRQLERLIAMAETTRETLDADMAQEQTEFTTLVADVTTAYNALIAKVNASEDYTAEDATVQTLLTQMQTADAEAKAGGVTTGSAASAVPAPGT